MSGNADDLRLFFRAGIGASFRVGLDITSRQTTDALGAIPPGKYIVQFPDLADADTVWVLSAPWVKGETITATAPAAIAAGSADRVNEFPVRGQVMRSFILHVRKGVNDRIAAIMSANTATMVITKLGE